MAKKSNKQQNPFVLAEYVGPEYFCDRTEETEGLIRNAFYHIRKSEKAETIDIVGQRAGNTALGVRIPL